MPGFTSGDSLHFKNDECRQDVWQSINAAVKQQLKRVKK